MMPISHPAPGSDAFLRLLLHDIHQQFQIYLQAEDAPRKKNTARARWTVIAKSEEKRYFIEWSDNPDAIFYLQKNQLFATKFPFSEYGIQSPIPVGMEQLQGQTYSVTELYDNTSELLTDPPELLWACLNSSQVAHRRSNAVIRTIKEGFLTGWPAALHQHITHLPKLQAWLDSVAQQDEITLQVEHGDLAPNNLLIHDGRLVVVDFEFSKESQPAGFDQFYNRLVRRKNKAEEIGLLSSHHLKYQLIQEINHQWDLGLINVIEYHTATEIEWVLINSQKKIKAKLVHFFFDIESFTLSELMPDELALTLKKIWHAPHAIRVKNIGPQSKIAEILKAIKKDHDERLSRKDGWRLRLRQVLGRSGILILRKNRWGGIDAIKSTWPRSIASRAYELLSFSDRFSV